MQVSYGVSIRITMLVQDSNTSGLHSKVAIMTMQIRQQRETSYKTRSEGSPNETA